MKQLDIVWLLSILIFIGFFVLILKKIHENTIKYTLQEGFDLVTMPVATSTPIVTSMVSNTQYNKSVTTTPTIAADLRNNVVNLPTTQYVQAVVPEVYNTQSNTPIVETPTMQFIQGTVPEVYISQMNDLATNPKQIIAGTNSPSEKYATLYTKNKQLVPTLQTIIDPNAIVVNEPALFSNISFGPPLGNNVDPKEKLTRIADGLNAEIHNFIDSIPLESTVVPIREIVPQEIMDKSIVELFPIHAKYLMTPLKNILPLNQTMNSLADRMQPTIIQ